MLGSSELLRGSWHGSHKAQVGKPRGFRGSNTAAAEDTLATIIRSTFEHEAAVYAARHCPLATCLLARQASLAWFLHADFTRGVYSWNRKVKIPELALLQDLKIACHFGSGIPSTIIRAQGQQLLPHQVYTITVSTHYSFPPLNATLSTLTPSSSCSSTLRSGNRFGMILLGRLPSTTLYLSNSPS